MYPLITIGVACYNVEKYIDRCMETLLNQTYPNLEIILVDDGSKDGTGDICDKYADHYTHVKVIHTPNQGLSGARNVSINNANGEYIGFVDPDDYVDVCMFEKLYDCMKENTCDLVICGRYLFKNHGEKSLVIPISQNGLIEKEGVMHLLLTDKLGSQAWQFLYKTVLWDDIRFTLGRVYAEDVALMHLVFDRASRIGVVPEPLYYYFINDSTLTTSYRPFKWMSLYLAFKERYDFTHLKYPQYEDEVKSIALNIARLTNDNYIIKRETVDDPYMQDLRAFLKSNKKFVWHTPYMKWYNKSLLFLYYMCSPLYCISIKYVHNIYYYFKPNKFR